MDLDLQFGEKMNKNNMYVFHLSKYELHCKNQSILAHEVNRIHTYPRKC